MTFSFTLLIPLKNFKKRIISKITFLSCVFAHCEYCSNIFLWKYKNHPIYKKTTAFAVVFLSMDWFLWFVVSKTLLDNMQYCKIGFFCVIMQTIWQKITLKCKSWSDNWPTKLFSGHRQYKNSSPTNFIVQIFVTFCPNHNNQSAMWSFFISDTRHLK